MNIKRNVLLNPGPATTTDTVKLAQVVPDICPREKEFAQFMKELRDDLVKVVHGDLEKYTAVPFCGSGTINMDVCLNSLLPADKKILIINNDAHESVGGAPTVASSINLCAIASGCGYPAVYAAEDEAGLMVALKKAKEGNGLTFIEVKCAIGARADLGRPTTTAKENREGFMNFLKGV